jgi:hypothetical protein
VAKGPSHQGTRETIAAAQARDLLTFAEALEDAGMTEAARRSRLVAQDCLWLVGLLADERSARAAMQAARDEAVDLLGQRAYEAMRKTA